MVYGCAFRTVLWGCNFLKERLQRRCFLVNIAKMLRKTFFIGHLLWLSSLLSLLSFTYIFTLLIPKHPGYGTNVHKTFRRRGRKYVLHLLSLLSSKKKLNVKLSLPASWTQDVNWKYIRRSINVLSPGGGLRKRTWWWWWWWWWWW